MADLSTTLPGLRLENPAILASGILGQTGESLLRIIKEGGAGAVVTKSIGPQECHGHSNPCVVELESGLLNAMGLPNPGIEAFGGEITKALEGGVPVIGSVFGSNPSEFSDVAVRMESYGVHALELNLSCPHTKHLGLELGADVSSVRDVVRAVKDSVKVPVYVKMSPMLPDIGGMAKVVEDAGGDAVVAINTVRAMKIEVEFSRPVLGNAVGGLSGPAIKSIGVRCVYEIANEVEIPVIGVGGISTGEDALEYIMAGASAVQIGTGVSTRGIKVFQLVCKEMEDFLDRNAYTGVRDVVGLARGV
jgi:dihydroorotate dehydrogenase (NAD+) catalytic subunit